MSWEIFVGITVLVGFIISIGKIISNNTKTMTEMKCSIDQLNKLLENYHDDVEKLTTKVEAIEGRIGKLEQRQ